MWYCLFGMYKVVLPFLSVGRTLDSVLLSVGDILVYSTQPRSQGLSSYRPLERTKDPGNEVVLHFHESNRARLSLVLFTLR